MTEQRCLYTLLHAPREQHEAILRELVTPVARELRGSPELDSLFFARFNVPDWQVRFRVLGRPDWIEGEVKERVEHRLAPLRESGIVEGAEFTEYERELERYGGPEGMALAEKLFLYDSLACLDLLEAEERGATSKSRREVSLLMAERTLDLFALDRARRMDFYAYGYRWALDLGTWGEDDLRLLEERYQGLKPGLEDLFSGDQSGDPSLVWGGDEPARIAEECLEAMRPVATEILAGHAAGRVRQDLVYLVWSYTHMHCNRLGIDPAPEAILRFFVHRFYQDGGGEA